MWIENLDFIEVPLLGVPQIQIAALCVEHLDSESWLFNGNSPISQHRRNHAIQYLQDADRQRSLGATLVLDHLLRKRGMREYQMTYGERGNHKPYFLHHSELHFNVSHSGKYAIGAIAPFPVGIDLEKVDNYQAEVARLCMTEREQAEINTTPISSRGSLFFTAWCAKEALLKAKGTGIDQESFPEILFAEGRVKIADQRFQNYHLRTFLLEDYQGALAYLPSPISNKDG